MRYPVAVTASIFSIALYFALFWGFDALRILTSPNYGLEDAWRSQVIYWIARWLGLGPQALLQMAAVFGAIKLAVSGVFAVHIFDRLRTFKSREVDHDILELGLLLVVGLSILLVAPAMWQHDATLVRTTTLNLVLASLAAALCALERAEKDDSLVDSRVAAVVAETEIAQTKARSAWYSPWR
jgi:hypothetical protein